MKKTIIIHCNPKENSLTKSVSDHIIEAAKAQNESVQLVDLYTEKKFSPILTSDEIRRKMSFDSTVNNFAAMVHDADLLVFLHPDWWGSVPALLKGFIDRVFLPGVAYAYEGPDFGNKENVPLLSTKQAIIGITSDSMQDDFLERWWKEKVLKYTGIEVIGFHFLPEVRKSNYSQRKEWIGAIEREIISVPVI